MAELLWIELHGGPRHGDASPVLALPPFITGTLAGPKPRRTYTYRPTGRTTASGRAIYTSEEP